MTYIGKRPVIKLVTQTYGSGVKLTKKAIDEIERQIDRLTNSTHEKFPNLGKWFIDKWGNLIKRKTLNLILPVVSSVI